MNNEDDMTRDFHALSMDNTTLLGTADSIALPSTDGQGETLEELDSTCPWIGDPYHSDDEVPGLINVTSLHSHFITNEQFFAFLDGSPIPITVDSDVSPVSFVADPPCTSLSSALLPTIEGPPTVPFSWNNSLPAPFSVQDISDAYHHVAVDVDSALPVSPPPYDSALWDPADSSDDEMPPLTYG